MRAGRPTEWALEKSTCKRIFTGKCWPGSNWYSTERGVDFSFNVTMNVSSWKAARDLEERPAYLVAIEAIVLGFIFLVSTIGNIFSCFIMYTTPRLRTWHNLLLLNVIVVDLLATLFCVPFGLVVLITGRWIGGDLLCSFVAYISCVLLTVSIVTLATISISRYFLITNLLKYMSVFKKKNIAWMLVAIWTLALLSAFPPLVGGGDFTFLPGNAMCFVYFGSSLPYAAVFTLLVIGLPVAVIIACFMKVRHLIKVNKRMRSLSSVTSIASEEIDSAKTLFSVVVMVLLCWFPMLLFFMLAAGGIEMPRQASLMATYAVFLTCALKPVIYFCMKKQFRAGFIVLLSKLLPGLHKRRRRNRVGNTSVKVVRAERNQLFSRNGRCDQFSVKQESTE